MGSGSVHVYRPYCFGGEATYPYFHITSQFSLIILMFIFERERASGGGVQRGGDRGSEAGSVLTAESLIWVWGLNSRTARSGPEPKSDT